jgi:hypothetical protein
MFGIDLADGAFVFLAFAVLYLYTRASSGISQHPYKHVYGGAPGAARESRMSGSADRDILSWSRGTR